MLIGRESLQASLKLLISLHVLFYFLSRWQVTCDDGQAFQVPKRHPAVSFGSGYSANVYPSVVYQSLGGTYGDGSRE